MKKIRFLLVAMFVVSADIVYAQTIITASSVTYQIKNLGITTDGTFGGLEADILFDPAKLDSSSIQASVQVNMIDSDNKTRDAHLKEEKFFDAERYPEIILKSISFQYTGDSTYLGKFDLTIKGITKPVDLPFTYVESNGKATYSGSFKIRRKDFNVGGSSMILADEVTVFICAETVK